MNKTRLVCSVVLMLVATCYFCGLTPAAKGQQTLFTTQIPAVPNVSDGPTTNYELGTEFTSKASGYITAIRFWKARSETGQHVGHIWSASGQLLASATFASETASGWQQQPLASPLAIAANAVYTVSVNTGNAYYAYTTNGLATAVVDQQLSSVVGNNGVSGPPSRFPTTGFYHTNYFRDIVFSPETSQTLFTTQIPAVQNVSDGPTTNYELGTEFTSSAPGYITAIRFWKARSETGQHIGHIWSASGQLLASATFASETASGWQQQPLASPLAIAANAVYIVSVNTGNTYYAYTTNGLAAAVVDQQLSSVVGNNGVSGPPSRFPTTGFYHTNYFRDIAFSPSSSPVGPAQSAISVVPASVSFGGVTVGTTNTQTMTVRNQGTVSLSVSQATVSGNGFKFSGLQLPLTVAPGASAAFTVSFAPMTTSSATGNLTITSNAPTSPTTIALSGTGVTATSQLTASPTSLSFGNVNVGSSSSHTVTLTNTGNTSVNVSGDSVTGAGFTTSGLTPVSLGAGQSTTFAVNFAPTAAGSVSGSVLVSSNATNSSAPIALSGSGVSTSTPAGPLAAFPGAQGGGAGSAGGRGGAVCEVTNLNDSGPNSFRDCVTRSGPRTVVFRVGGTIQLLSQVTILNPYITIAGQTAPGGGILLSGQVMPGPATMLFVGTHDVTIRYIRIRAGGGSIHQGTVTGICALAIMNYDIYNVIVDHVSISWASNKHYIVHANYGPGIHNVTLQWTFTAEGLQNESVLGGVGDSNGTYTAFTDIDFHHNFWADHSHRLPLTGQQTMHMVNNIIYNWSFYATGTEGPQSSDIIGNLYKPGPYYPNAYKYEMLFNTTGGSSGFTGTPSIYLLGNKGPNQPNSSANQWAMTNINTVENGAPAGAVPASWQRTTPLPTQQHPITADDVNNLENILLPTVGDSQNLDCNGNWVMNRDAVDTRIISEYYAGTGIIPTSETQVGGFPTIAAGTPCTESMHDGIPDVWKTAHGYSTTANIANQVALNGYTVLENYLNGTNPNSTIAANSTVSLLAASLAPKAKMGSLMKEHLDVTPLSRSLNKNFFEPALFPWIASDIWSSANRQTAFSRATGAFGEEEKARAFSSAR